MRSSRVYIAIILAAIAIRGDAQTTAPAVPAAEKQFLDEVTKAHNLKITQIKAGDPKVVRDIENATGIINRVREQIAAGKLQEALGDEHDIIAAVGPVTTRDALAAEVEFATQALSHFGPDDYIYDLWLTDLSTACIQRGNPGDEDRAARYASLAIAGLEKSTRGRPSSLYGAALHSLGASQLKQGKTALAVASLRHSLALTEASEGRDKQWALCANDLGEALRELGGFNTEAHQYLTAAKTWLDEERSRADSNDLRAGAAVVLNNLAMLSLDEGDFDECHRLELEALAIHDVQIRMTRGTPDEKFAIAQRARCLSQLGITPLMKPSAGNNEKELAENHEAEKYLIAAAIDFEAVNGADDADAVHARLSLGLLYALRGDYADAIKLIEPPKAAEQAAPPQLRVDLLRLRSALAINAGSYDLALQYTRQWLELAKQFYGPSAPLTAGAHYNLAIVAALTEKPKDADKEFRQTLAIAHRALELTYAAEPEQRQLVSEQTFRNFLDGYVSFRLCYKWTGHGDYDEVLQWKGAVFSREVGLGKARNSTDPAVRQLFTRLEQASQQVSSLVFEQARDKPSGQDGAGWKKRQADRWAEVEALNTKMDGWLTALSASDAGRTSANTVNVAAIEKALPSEAALVDFLQFTRHPKQIPGQVTPFVPSYVVFVVRHDKVVTIDLGASAPIDAAVIQWTKDRCRDTKAGLAVRKLIWDQLAPALTGAKLILVSPDSTLGNVPFGALPDDDGAYLIEQYAFASIPVPQLLPTLLQTPESKAGTALIVSAEVPIVGRPIQAPASSPWARAPRLDYAAGEVRDIQQLFGSNTLGLRIRSLVGPDASKDQLRKAIGTASYLHYAGHAFFEPGLRRAIESQHGSSLGAAVETSGGESAPAAIDSSLLCGLILAPDPAHADDGALTAYEIARMDLRNLNLAVLSGCDTALGESAGGEGLLSLQRACQVAGARTVIASLWPVQDQATQRLMKYFYADLLANRHNQSLPLISLRRAQLKVMREAPGERHTISIIGEIDAPPSTGPRQPPAIWAPWVLSGSPGNLQEIIREMDLEK